MTLISQLTLNTYFIYTLFKNLFKIFIFGLQRDEEEMVKFVRNCPSEFKEYYIQMQTAKRCQAPIPSQVNEVCSIFITIYIHFPWREFVYVAMLVQHQFWTLVRFHSSYICSTILSVVKGISMAQASTLLVMAGFRLLVKAEPLIIYRYKRFFVMCLL